MNLIQIILIGVGIIITVIVLTLTITNTFQIKNLNTYVFGVFARLDDENYTLWKAKEKAENKLKRKKRATLKK